MEKLLDILRANAATDLGISLNDGQLSLFAVYLRELLAWNEKINLVSVKSDLDIPIKHFIDSLTPLPLLKDTSKRLLDIGTGAGFPGVPLKIAMPSLKVFLLEASRKKASFLKHIIRTLDLDGITVIHNRVEHIMQDDTYKGFFDTVISRATLKIPDLLRFGAWFLCDNGILIAMKGPDGGNEWKNATELSAISKLMLLSSHHFRLPATGDGRTILLYKKIGLHDICLK
jgi:16S rRNA (guanine527-N7)-methyltransferase